ncbi:TIGR02302 family protein [Microvirga pudoricolor]|uniref:TIGR02302 family protein n=1 Tax=Microvirga pudoricolor TaxID=2778729 RepID=UPI0019515BC1|nr:TIGR02302 family protein [Microvirga pudoricolor]MBM6595486.1 TIGR02302 family protein [Microvirga pudoricolor]
MSEGPRPGSGPNHLQKRLDRLVGQARLALWWEEAWPRLWLPLAVGVLFLTASFFGLWLETPPLWRAVGLGLFGLALLVSLWPLARLPKVRRGQALDRLDRDAGQRHGPARALDDSLALGSSDAGTRALWDLHRRRAEASLGTMRVTPPRPDMPRRDRYAFRAAGLLALAASAFVAGPEAWPRLAAAFDWKGAKAAAPAFRVDGWIDPPLYTRTPPLMIDLAAGQQHLRAPVKSTVVIRVAGQGDAAITPIRGLTALPAKENARTDLREERFTLDGNAELSVKTGLASGVTLTLEAIPDKPPVIAFSAPPEVNARGTFSLVYKGSDDYGITAIEGSVEKADTTRGKRSLVPAPALVLALPGDGNAETKSPVDLTNHPWAGARVKIKLTAKDEAGQEGMSEAIEFTLPQRPFTNPLAKALVEQRRNLVLDPDDRKRTQTALDALLIAPDLFTPQWGVFMGLRMGADRLRRAKSDADLTEVADWLWTMALQIEDGNLSDAERELRAAQDRLKEAMDRGATDEEIRRLTEELRTAMDKFLREFAQRMQQNQQNQQNQAQNQRSPDRMISQDDLNRMLQQMEEAMRRGDMAEAERLLNQLRNILENLQTAQPNSRMSDPMNREMNQAMQDLENMAREQQQLRDETFQDGQNRRMQQGDRRRQQPGQRGQNQQGQRQQGQQGQQGEGQEQAENGQDGEGQEGQQGQGQQGLSQRQQALRERLRELQDKMRGMGMQGEQGLGDAEQAMREAENAIGQGQDGPAVDAQGRALENLRRGMQGMAQQMQQMQQGDGQDQQQAGDQPGQGEPRGQGQTAQDNNDPLGRPTRNRDITDGRVRVPGANESAAERARQILEELRRKLGDPTRPQEELDYFDRLLRRN